MISPGMAGWGSPDWRTCTGWALCWWASLLLHWPLHAAPHSPWSALADKVFKHLSVEQGLPHTSVTALLEDADGFIWVGTQGGLARWDGYRFRAYQPDPHDSHSLPDNYITSMALDKQGRLWIGTNSGGLARYDAWNDQFVRIPVGAHGISHVAVNAIVHDGANGLWVASRAGLDHYFPDSGRVTQLRHNPDDARSLPDNHVRSLLRDSQGRLWVGTNEGLAYQAGQSAKESAKDGQFITLALPDLAKPAIASLGQSQDGKIWLGVVGKGVFLIQPGVQPVVHRFTVAQDTQLNQETITAMVELAPNDMWFGSVGQGLVLLENSVPRRLTHDPSLATSLTANSIGAILRDRSGLIWIGTHRGINIYDPTQAAILSAFGNPQRHHGMSDTDVTAMALMPDGKVWLGLLGQGIHIVDPMVDQVTWLRADPRFAKINLQANRVFAISRPLLGSVYIGTDRGLFRSDVNGQSVQRVTLAPRDSHFPVRALLQDGQQLWVGGTDGLWLHDGSDPAHLQTRRVPGTESLYRRIIQVVVAGKDGDLWIGTTDNGVYRYHIGSARLQHFAPDPSAATGLAHGNVANILFDTRGRVWAASQGGGLNLLLNTRPPGAWRHFGVAQGLPHELVNKVLEDNQGQIWVSTDAGLARIDPDRFTVLSLQRAEGVVIPAYWINSGVKTKAGEILFGGVGGITILHPDRLQNWDYRPPLMVTSVQIGGKPVPPHRLNHWPAGAPGLLIQPDANSLTLEFAALDYSAPERNRYAYRLDGYDKGWIASDASRRLAAYTNLPAGEYRLRLRGSNRNGVWNERELVLPVRVIPGWQQTWWFRSALVLALALLVLALIHMRTRYLRQRQLELEAQVEQRTIELKQKQAQLVEQEKLASLGGLVAGVAHEINTPIGTALMALSGAQEVWKKFALALGSGQVSKSRLEQWVCEGGEYTLLAHNAATRVADLVVSFKAIAVGSEQEISVVLDIEAYLHDLVTLLCAPLAALGVTIEVAVSPDLRIPIVCGALTEALTRIIHNVHDHAFVNAPTDILPTLKLTASAKPDGRLLLTVQDNGCGIVPEHLAFVFEPFFTTKSGLGGHIGLGLYVAYNQIVQRLKGEMSIDSTLGQGCCVSICLPPDQYPG